MFTLSLLGAVEALRGRRQLPTRYINIKELLNRFQPTPPNSLRALILQMYDLVPGISYHVVPIFWGPTFPPPNNEDFRTSTPYSPKQLEDALNEVANAAYFSLLNQYGARDISISPMVRFDDPWPAGNSYYVAMFTDDDIVNFIKGHIRSLPAASEDNKPIYMVVLPHGSLRDVNANGAHATFDFQEKTHIWFWMYGSPNISAALRIATHEIAESVGADGSQPKELCDDCAKEFPTGWKTTVNNLPVESYYDEYTDSCVAPGSIRPESR